MHLTTQPRVDLHLLLHELQEEVEALISSHARIVWRIKTQLRICMLVHQMRGGEVVSQTRLMNMSTRVQEYNDKWYIEVAELLVKKLDEYMKNVVCGMWRPLRR